MLTWLDSATGIAVASATFVALCAGGVRWWTRKDLRGRPKAWPRRLAAALDQAIHVLIGREELRDPEKPHKVIRTEQPPLTERMVRIEDQQETNSGLIRDMSKAFSEQLELREELADQRRKHDGAIKRIHERFEVVEKEQESFDRRLRAVEGVRVETPDTTITVGPAPDSEGTD